MVYLGHGIARGISSRQSGKRSDLSMERERLRGRTAPLICSYLPFCGVGDRCDGVTGDARHWSMVCWWQVAALSVVQDAGCRVFRQWKRPAVRVPFLPVCLEVQDVGRCAVSAAGLVSESPTTLFGCTMTAWVCLRGVSHSLPSEAGIAVASCVVIEMFS